MPSARRKRSLASAYFGSPTVGLDYLEQMASYLKLPWNHIISSLSLPKASLSRLKHGTAGPKTVDRVLKAIEDRAAEYGRTERELAGAASDVLTWAAIRSGDIEVPPGASTSRHVIVRTARGDRFFGTTFHGDDEIVRTKAVRLLRYREISGKLMSLGSLATHGPKDSLYTSEQIGPQFATGVLVLDVVEVHECTPDAAQEFSEFR